VDISEVTKTRRGGIERISLCNVALDIVSPENLESAIYGLIDGGGDRNIVLLSLWDLLRARKAGEYRNYVQGAALIIPISKSLVSGARFLKHKTPFRYMPFDFVISLLSILERREFTVYLLGSKAHILKRAERNMTQTFPGLRVVGRHSGGYKKQAEETLLTAMKKAAPSLMLVGKGVHGREKWLARHTAKLSPGLRLWCSDIFEVFAEKKRRPSRSVFEHGLEWFGFCMRNPLRFFRVFPYFGYKLLLLGYKLFKRETSSAPTEPTV
jgi:N-acetylglucosaminyldiphosphoundecaprenol N-acetyl-beta-D-mannosaminyltransferase